MTEGSAVALERLHRNLLQMPDLQQLNRADELF